MAQWARDERMMEAQPGYVKKDPPDVRVERPASTPRGKARQALQAGMAGLRAAESTLDAESMAGLRAAESTLDVDDLPHWDAAFYWMTRVPVGGLDWALDLVEALDNLETATLAEISFKSLAVEARCRGVAYEHFIKNAATAAVSKRADLALRVDKMLKQIKAEKLGINRVPRELEPGWPPASDREVASNRELFASIAAANPELVTPLQAELGALEKLDLAQIVFAKQALDARRRGLPDNLDNKRAETAALRAPFEERVKDLLLQFQERVHPVPPLSPLSAVGNDRAVGTVSGGVSAEQ